QRDPEKPAVQLGLRAPLRAHQARPRRQRPASGLHTGPAASALRAAVHGQEPALTTPRAQLYGTSLLLDPPAHIDKYGAALNAALGESDQRCTLTWAVGMDVPSYRRTLEISEKCGWVKQTFGIHPNRAHEYAENFQALAPWIKRSPALGEI